ncbi:MAG: putative zinc protease [Chroococcopsis gigantea SAG 12.99]|jgi:zinc protease|nr:insulinase family protein [Chlorogloea purpurea SAG 13.99]MDV2998560.1 putative zinc protease [Chroococcopsis gigantea SAG 12.99]
MTHSALETQQIHRQVLDNGITLLHIENPTADIISGRIFLKNGGTRWEKREKAGLFHLLATLLTKGTEKRSAVEIAETIESIGANLGADTATDYFLLSLKTVSADFAFMLGLAAEILLSPSLTEGEIELEKKITRQSIRSQSEQPFNIAFNQLREAMYPLHPYGVSVLGTEETVSGLTRFDLQSAHAQFFRPDNTIISISGRIDLESAIDLVKETFAPWQNPGDSMESLELSPPIVNPSRRITARETQQAIVMLGYLGVPVKHQDYATLKLLSTYLGNGLSSRLFVELREKRGLAYDVSCLYPTRLDTSSFVMYMGTAPDNTSIALEGLSAEASRLREILLTPEELQSAKNKLLGQYALGKQTNAELAQLYGWYETLGLGIEYDEIFPRTVKDITVEMIQDVASRYLQEPYISLVGPASVVNM